jgi:hypothetical protein
VIFYPSTLNAMMYIDRVSIFFLCASLLKLLSAMLKINKFKRMKRHQSSSLLYYFDALTAIIILLYVLESLFGCLHETHHFCLHDIQTGFVRNDVVSDISCCFCIHCHRGRVSTLHVHHRVSHRVVRWNLVGFIVSCISRALLYVNLCFSLTHSNLINEKRMSYCQRVNAALYEMVFKAKQTPDSSGPSSSSTEQGWFFSSRAGNNKTTQQPRSRFVAVYRQTHRLC